ncbi:hypothetical protein ABLT98_16605 [Acinetobacter baumannii]|uniref:hypothetical protein n=1 Tax=Acinetobacter baumannii TaxID=470 RepID=UPI0032B483F7
MKVQVLKKVDVYNLDDHESADFQVYFATLKTSGNVIEVFLSKSESGFEYKLNGDTTYISEMDWEEYPIVEGYEIESLRQIVEIEV